MFSKTRAPERQMKREVGQAVKQFRVHANAYCAIRCLQRHHGHETASSAVCDVPSTQTIPAGSEPLRENGVYSIQEQDLHHIKQTSHDANAEVNDQANDVVGGGDKRTCSQRRVNLEPVQRQWNEGAKQGGEDDDGDQCARLTVTLRFQP